MCTYLRRFLSFFLQLNDFLSGTQLFIWSYLPLLPSVSENGLFLELITNLETIDAENIKIVVSREFFDVEILR